MVSRVSVPESLDRDANALHYELDDSTLDLTVHCAFGAPNLLNGMFSPGFQI
jgi:hypothetical protein